MSAWLTQRREDLSCYSRAAEGVNHLTNGLGTFFHYNHFRLLLQQFNQEWSPPLVFIWHTVQGVLLSQLGRRADPRVQPKLILNVGQVLSSNCSSISANQVSKKSDLWTCTLDQLLKKSKILPKDFQNRRNSTGKYLLHQVVV